LTGFATNGVVVMNKLQPLALGVAFGVLWAAYVFFAGIFAMYDWGVAVVSALGTFYIGYGPSILGAIIGAIWAFVDGLVAGAIIAWIYNLVAKVTP
jgi:hypothetical protein